MKRLFILLLLAGSAHAEVYKSINAAGEVVYSDTRTQGAETMKMPALPTYTPPPVTPSTTTKAESLKTAVYENFVFLKPEDDATIRNNQGIINAELKLTPALRSRLNHRVQFYLDGEVYGKPGSSIRTTMSDVDRGEHSLTASVLDANGDSLISADPVIVHLHRESIHNPNHPNNPSRPRPTPLPSVR
jgi:hypothetical protein